MEKGSRLVTYKEVLNPTMCVDISHSLLQKNRNFTISILRLHAAR